jgi:IS30 family transposase
MQYTQLTEKERDMLAVWRGQGLGIREMGRQLGRSAATVSRELRRNGHTQAGYVAIHAQRLAKARFGPARVRYPLKDPATYAYVLAKLQSGWSPEQIAGRLAREHGNVPVIHPETIYRFIYDPANVQRKFWEYLPWGRPKRRRQHGRHVHRSHIPQRVSVHQRPTAVNDRTEFGHYEDDTVEGKGHRDGIRTSVERRSRKLFAGKVSRIASAETIRVQRRLFAALPPVARRSTTMDNGREHHRHHTLHLLGMRTFFADPYSSWQRGTNEFTNGLLRRYFPKGTDFTPVTDDDLQDVVDELNDRPRKCLHYATPSEVFNDCLQAAGVALTMRM